MNSLRGSTNNVNASLQRVETTTGELRNGLGQVNTNVENVNSNLQNLGRNGRNNLDRLDESQQRLNQHTRTFGDILRTVYQFYIASLPARMMETAVREAVNTIKEFDSALTEFKKVSDLSGESLQDYTDKLGVLGEQTAKTTAQMVSMSTEFRKSGFSDAESAELANVASLYQNIADEEVEAGDAANYIIAQMKAFNVTAEDSMHIIDATNEVANNYAVSSADLANNVGKISSALSVQGNSFEQLLGMTTAITEITRSASTAVRGLRMVASRLTQTLDENSSTGKKLTEIYEGLGISLRDSEGQLRSTFDILQDLSKQWDNLSTNERDYIALTSAGANQLERLKFCG